MVWLITESDNKESFYAPYLGVCLSASNCMELTEIGVLPKDFSTHPLYWSEEELAELQASSVRGDWLFI